ncbi:MULTISPECIES: ribosome biogenesis GTP-binding protein YihA/YsxC [Streptococcus]|jgi:GTP-binding protein|uniref:ribosome biogenesis GTP-binding protein YihA/YsxC n=1 Tax=Streptococcus TaxID=1301 RepID=UPI0008A88E1D|nr:MULTISPECIES: ribosome biogenesis GTP-binding protein YihA/YsxC [Streptococcus]KAA9306817.1 YihA family ribosome biogenesis GTP-binding protein [Streptococcus anginosus]MCW0934102.1 ribosome biogenesis GTP-binding protein YihA/YsxC [Streptococcus anginosus]MCW0995363.1 ribosome biogenesis GTP-binding protein YihA/YsxC [Streptococcus anginosus]MCW1001172.1 ribosome biogenesis GTP-binding protein YihA/YsxC [Streptococcus anginosus]MCW1027657.1 ribosome biogenesis GTP-binding protein YihA/YsxC
MEINTHNAEILLSAANKSHYPQDEIPEIALAGRSNVGKSSFINTLLNRKNLARTSGKPGKTQLLNFFNIDDKLRFVDVPGYGYAKVSKTERAKWGKMIEEYLTSRENLRAVVSLVDFRHEPSADDVQMYEFLKYYEIPVIVVATKADKIPRGKWNKHESVIKKKLDFDKNDDFIVFSSVNKDGLDAAWNAILEKI